MQKIVLIVAGGVGSRFTTATPKQFALLNGRPVLMHVFDAFLFLNDVRFILVLPKTLVAAWRNLCTTHHFTLEHKITESGPKRFHSVKSGLKPVADDRLVAIHDGVRPLVSKATIQRCFQLAEKKGSGIPAVPIQESLREIKGVFSHAVNRDDFRIVQTPQVFHSSLLKKAYEQNYHEKFTDDAVVFENAGNQIFLTEGNRENIKITEPVDLIIAEKLISIKSIDK